MSLSDEHLAFASSADAADPLRNFRDRFSIPADDAGNEVIYFTGNSLGLMPKTVPAYVQQELQDWERLAVEGHLKAKNPWLPYHEFLTEAMARIIGAQPIETVVMNALTVNLHILLISFYRPTTSRFKIVIEKGAFPSDQYAVKSHLTLHGYSPAAALVELTPRTGESTIRTEDIIETIQADGESIALILLGGVNYYSGQAFEMGAITEAGHHAGAVVGFDLAHAAGNIELSMHDWGVDFAAWCSYKYLNGGPGAVGGAFVHERHAESFDLPRFAGWWGHDKETRFLMGPDFKPMPGAEGWQVSNPPILQMAALRASLEIFHQVGMPALVEKSRKLTGFLEGLISSIGNDRISIITPSDPGQRGCQLSIRVGAGGRSVHEKLMTRGVFADWREPDVIRVAPVPLYNSFADVTICFNNFKSVLYA
ncbi:MAG: kynureninase [Pyrinomonadaceae bacterium]